MEFVQYFTANPSLHNMKGIRMRVTPIVCSSVAEVFIKSDVYYQRQSTFDKQSKRAKKVQFATQRRSCSPLRIQENQRKPTKVVMSLQKRLDVTPKNFFSQDDSRGEESTMHSEDKGILTVRPTNTFTPDKRPARKRMLLDFDDPQLL